MDSLLAEECAPEVHAKVYYLIEGALVAAHIQFDLTTGHEMITIIMYILASCDVLCICY